MFTPVVPVHSVCDAGVLTAVIETVEVRRMASRVPPRPAVLHRTIQSRKIIVFVLRREITAIVLAQRISYKSHRKRSSADMICDSLPSCTLHCATITLPLAFDFFAEK